MPDTPSTRLDPIAALRTSGLISASMTLREIIDASQKIPGIGDGSPVAWELVNRDFVLRGRAVGPEMGKSDPLSARTIDALQQSKVMNFEMTLGTLLEMSAKLPGLESGMKAGWELVTRDFVLRG